MKQQSARLPRRAACLATAAIGPSPLLLGASACVRSLRRRGDEFDHRRVQLPACGLACLVALRVNAAGAARNLCGAPLVPACLRPARSSLLPPSLSLPLVQSLIYFSTWSLLLSPSVDLILPTPVALLCKPHNPAHSAGKHPP